MKPNYPILNRAYVKKGKKKNFGQSRTTDVCGLIAVGGFLKDLLSAKAFKIVGRELLNCTTTSHRDSSGLVR